jgi:hypothetical protein
MSLHGEGFEDVATCDRLLGDLDRGTEQLDPRTVVVVDEAGMVGSASWAACSSTPSRRRPRWSWSKMTGSWRRSMPVAASVPSASDWGPPS